MLYLDLLKALHVNEMCQPNLNIAKYYQTKIHLYHIEYKNMTYVTIKSKTNLCNIVFT